jgi:hypothetical protein
VNALPLLGLLLAIADAVTHWEFLRWLGYLFSIVGQFLAVTAWLKSRRSPQAVTYACPNRCGFLGDQAGCDAHAECCRVQWWAA